MQDCGAPLKPPCISCNYVALSVHKKPDTLAHGAAQRRMEYRMTCRPTG
jgi:hypothetical protein